MTLDALGQVLIKRRKKSAQVLCQCRVAGVINRDSKGKGGAQRGTSRREDVLDTVVKLERPDDYRPSEGARFIVTFEKSRGFTGKEAETFEAALIGGVWATRDLEDVRAARIIELDRDALVAGELLKKGKYSLFTIPTATDWTIIFNGKVGQWGVFYKEDTDVLRVSAPSRAYVQGAEQFFISFEPQSGGMNMLLTWDETQAVVPFRTK